MEWEDFIRKEGLDVFELSPEYRAAKELERIGAALEVDKGVDEDFYYLEVPVIEDGPGPFRKRSLILFLEGFGTALSIVFKPWYEWGSKTTVIAAVRK